MRRFYQEPRKRVRPPKEKPFAGGTPHQHAAHDAGGALTYHGLPSREKWNAELARYAPGCGAPTYVDGTNGSQMPCGGLLHGKPHFCSHCLLHYFASLTIRAETHLPFNHRSTRNARNVVDSLLNGGKKKPYWEREREKAHQDELERLRGLYGHDKTEPDARQAAVLRRLWQAGKHRRFMDYARQHGLNPNKVIAGI